MGVEYKVILLRLANAKKRERHDRPVFNSPQRSTPAQHKIARPATSQQVKKQHYAHLRTRA